jgi:hypothetical protein
MYFNARKTTKSEISLPLQALDIAAEPIQTARR